MTEKTRGTTKSLGRKQLEDKFYTLPEAAAECLKLVDLDNYETKIEPSAGSGSFSSLVDGCLALDIKPEHSGVVKQDWFEYSAKRVPGKTLVFGNPPFGQQNSLAVKFINHAATFADTIAFVLPMSFRKASVQKRLNKNLHLREEWILPKDSFTLNDEPYHVPCVFQIWDYKDHFRDLTKMVQPVGFRFVKKEQYPTLAVQRVGGRAGKASMEWRHKSIQSNYFLQLDNPEAAEGIVEALESISIEGRDYGVGPRTVSKAELTSEVNRILAEL